MACQIVHDSFLRRGFCDAYTLALDGEVIGYLLIDNKFYPGTVDEFFVMPQARGSALALFRLLLDVSQATRIRAQTNDLLLLLMLYDCATDITVENVLFADGLTSSLACPGGVLERKPGDGEEWQIVANGRPVAEGGLLFHYNPPYADIFMEVQEGHRRRGYGSYLVQELKRIAYALGKIPAARCNADNTASRQTLERAGMLPCGRILRGDVRR
jgi:GNAT superfamily N-acetyltransferase